MTNNDVVFIGKLKPLFQPFRYKVLYGGRAGLKSWSIARALLLIGAERPLRVLCAREYQTSISQSVFTLLQDQIETLGLKYDKDHPLDNQYQVTKNRIYNNLGTSFTFAGLHHNIDNIKSTESVDVCWVEEAHTVSEESWLKLIPTIRKAGSEIWISFNPENESDPVYQQFVVNPPPRSFVVKTSWRDNKWITPEIIEAKDHLKSVDYDSYLYVWEGEFLKRSKAHILIDKLRIDVVMPQSDWSGPYIGLDHGFANDPTRMVKLWIHGKKLYIEKEVNGFGVDIDQLPNLYRNGIPESTRYPIRADNARPEIIAYLRKSGFPQIVPVKKGPGSVEQGISFLRSFEEIVVDPSCKYTIEEFKLYKYKTDSRTGEVLPEIVDKWNHSVDGCRYALEPLMPHKQPGTIKVIR